MVTGLQYAQEALKIFNLEPKAGYIWGTRGVLWTKARQEQLDKTTDENRKYSRVYGKKWIGHYVWDCSGLTSDCGKKLGLSYHHGSNSSYLYDCSKKGKLTKTLDIPVGAFVYTGDDSKKPHIGVYTGNGMVTEAAGTIKGVIQTKLHGGKWKYWGLGKGITFDFIPGEVKPSTTVEIADKIPEKPKQDVKVVVPINYPLLRRGSEGDLVSMLQDFLSKDGFDLKVDGIFGPITQRCVKEFQKKYKLKVDGIVGPQTWGELLKHK